MGLEFLKNPKGPGKDRRIPFPFHLEMDDFYIWRESFPDRTFSDEGENARLEVWTEVGDEPLQESFRSTDFEVGYKVGDPNHVR